MKRTSAAIILCLASVVGQTQNIYAQAGQFKALYPGKKIAIADGAMACIDIRQLHYLAGIQDSGDQSAFVNFVKDKTNGCVVARKGVIAYVQQRLEGRPRSNEIAAVCVRPEGMTSCIWVFETSADPAD